ncbi:hypothetical protein LTR22_009195 [Elasticomyces elasticus]|nr:hypothetical protein LTR22_009195 [Elasticomyces elasticus]KAK5762875.1 hypothetical protein LTS12_007064 [Elasticomyces elasticus]
MAEGGVVSKRVKACNACRQHKLRCDAHENAGVDCSRCRRIGRECIFTTTFKRRARHTRADLQRELDAICAQRTRQESSATSPSTDRNAFIYNDAATANFFREPENALIVRPSDDESANVTSAVHDDTMISSSPSQAILSYDPDSHGAFGAHQSPPSLLRQASIPSTTSPFAGSAGTSSRHTNAGCSDRKLGTTVLDGRKIDGCYETYLRSYAPVVWGLFDQEQSPDDLYHSSPLLFWAVMYVGSRGYQKDPTASESIMGPLKALLHHALFDPENAIPTIQAAVLVCLWPFPVDSTFKDPSHAVAGAAMHLAVQKGLQYASRKQDYARVALVQAEADRMFRARLWAYCVVAFQGWAVYVLPQIFSILTSI